MSGELPSDIELPEVVKLALAREPIVLGKENIGRHFRNAEEIKDLKEVLEARPRDVHVLSLGLIGSRTQGRFTYSVEELFWKLIYKFKQAPALDLVEEELDWLLVTRDWHEVVRKTPKRVFESVLPLARFLKEQASLHTNFSDINLEALPPELKKFVQVEVDFVPFRLRPDSAKETVILGARIIPMPAAFYPDIDILAIAAPGATRELGAAAIGPRSGTYIEVDSTPSDDTSLRAEELLSKFRPTILSS